MRLTVNGTEREVAPHPDRSLLHVLREELGLTGTKLACGEGVCGACTVMVDGTVVRACITPLIEVADQAVTTIEGLAPANGLHPLQRAFLDEAAFQCGFCTPGMIVAATGALSHETDATADAVHAALDGNLCRCGTYPRILRAVERARESPTTEPEAAAERIDDLPPSASEPWDLSDDHDALWTWLGDGLLVVSDDRRAWLHVGASGIVTVASGKVDVGQGSTAEIAGIVVAHLGIAPPPVRVVLADTDLTPYDMGTFGSRTTPDVVPAVAGAATAARLALEATAAAEWGVGAASVETRDGRVTSTDGGRTATFAELVHGLRRVETAEAAQPTARTPANVTRAIDVVTGRRRYTSDLTVPGMLHGRVLRPPGPDAELMELDAGGVDVIDGAHVVRDGDLIGVVAPDPLTATRALEALRPRWSATSGPSSETLETYLRAHPTTVEGWGGEVDQISGDPDRALASAPIRLSATYTAAYIAHDPLETRAALASWDNEGRVTVRTGSQRPFGIREALAEALAIGENQVRIVVPATGGAYGGKHNADAALEAARLARAAGHPVKVRWTREEEMAWGYARPAAVIDVRSGAEPDGTLIAWEFTNLNAGARALEPPYRVPNVHVRFQPAAGPLPEGAYRALSATANTFARESHVDEIAHAVAADPLELRLRLLEDDRLADVLRAAADAAAWPGQRVARHAFGLACGEEKDSRVATVVTLDVGQDAALRVERIVTAFECGRIVDPENLRNQVEGAQVMALGGALFEALELTDGRVANTRQSEYPAPRFSDVPPIEVILLDRPDLPSSGAGETPMIALAPAIANAIFAATAVRIRSMPLTPRGCVS
jgi:nicotinate dehydrogenase subunit B